MRIGRVQRGHTVMAVVLSDDGAHVRAHDGSTGDIPLSDVKILPPVEPMVVLGSQSAIRRDIESPGKVDTGGRTRSEHFARMRTSPLPWLFHKALSSITAPGDPIVFPAEAEHVIVEAEIGIVIGTSANRVPRERIWDHVAGVTLVNDVTCVDFTMDDDDYFRGKSQPGFCPIGPWVTTDVTEERILAGLEIVTRINGEVVTSADSTMLRWSPSEMVSHASFCMSLNPGDVIHTGCAAPAPGHPGDVCSIEIEGLGVLENPIVAGMAGTP